MNWMTLGMLYPSLGARAESRADLLLTDMGRALLFARMPHPPSSISRFARLMTDLVSASRRRQNGDRIDLVERAVAGQRAHLDHRARRRWQVRIEELRAHLAHQRLMRPQVDQILRELDDMLEAAAGGRQRGSNVLIGLCRLRFEIPGRADDVAVAVEAHLAGDEENAAGNGRLHDVRISRLLGAWVGLQEAQMPRRLAGAEYGLRERGRARPGDDQCTAGSQQPAAREGLLHRQREAQRAHDASPSKRRATTLGCRA